MFLLSSALAAEPGDAFLCPALAEPADGLRYADPGEISAAAYDAIEDWVLAQYDDDCPAACSHLYDCAYTNDCYTAAGAHIVVDFARGPPTDRAPGWDNFDEVWTVNVESGDGVSVSLEFREEYTADWNA